jgi:hypothetical protein
MGAVPGNAFSGIIAAVGEGAGELRTGAAVFGMNDWFSDDAMTLLERGNSVRWWMPWCRSCAHERYTRATWRGRSWGGRNNR